MAEAFYPFVDNGGEQTEPELVVRHPARIAVFDDPAAAPRVVVVDPKDVRGYLEEITATVTKLAQEQGGKIPFTVIREVVENLIHAYFIEPTISILDHGNTIRFSDQGPGITDKQRALEYGTTSATAQMKRYIRGVGSGLPYAQQWLEEKGGSLSVEDNIHNGTVVTVSLSPREETAEGSGQDESALPQMLQQQAYPINPQVNAYQSYGAYPALQGIYPAQAPYPQQGAWPQQPTWQQTAPQQQPAGAWGQPWAQQAPYPQGYPQQPYAAAPTPAPAISERGAQALDYLRTHEAVGPRDLNAIWPLSESTWSRTLAQLKDQGLIIKSGGQKYHLTPQGRQLLGV